MMTLLGFRKFTARIFPVAIAAISAGVVVGCSDRSTSEVKEATFIENYATIVHASYQDSLFGARALGAAVDQLIATPTNANLAAAREAWITARKPYLQTEVYRFYAGPIDDEDGPEPWINAWPMDESYIDYVEGLPNSGVINRPDLYPEITAEVLVELNEKEGETAIACGYHAIEFLLWGQDQSETGPGARPATDYSTHPQADRRKTYLKVCSELLIGHLEGLVAEWAPEKPDNFRAGFVAEPERSTWRASTGVRHLAGIEFASDRLLVAWDTQLEEEEHSCFSDTTHVDIQYDAMGLENVLMGSYTRTDGSKISGPGLLSAAAEVGIDTALLEKTLVLVVEQSVAIPVPFDQAILGEDDAPGRVAILELIESLESLSAELAKVETALADQLK